MTYTEEVSDTIITSLICISESKEKVELIVALRQSGGISQIDESKDIFGFIVDNIRINRSLASLLGTILSKGGYRKELYQTRQQLIGNCAKLWQVLSM